MYAFSYDKAAAALVGVYGGAPAVDADYELALRSTAQLLDEAGGKIAVRLVVVDPAQGDPNALWRKRLTEIHNHANPYRYAIVGQLQAKKFRTALDWMRQPAPQHRTHSCETFQQAVDWLEAERGQSLPMLEKLYSEARARIVTM